MYIIDIALKNAPTMMSVQRKSAEDAQAVYRQIVDAMNSGNPVFVELTCELQPGKQVAILVNEIAAVQVAEKSGIGTSSGRPPGFYVQTTDKSEVASGRL
jgi:hypothetical protein